MIEFIGAISKKDLAKADKDTIAMIKGHALVRCWECRFYTPLNRETKSGICSLLIHQNFGDDWYCAGAERRTDEQTD